VLACALWSCEKEDEGVDAALASVVFPPSRSILVTGVSSDSSRSLPLKTGARAESTASKSSNRESGSASSAVSSTPISDKTLLLLLFTSSRSSRVSGENNSRSACPYERARVSQRFHDEH